MTESQFNVPASNPGEPDDSTQPEPPAPDLTEQQTATYAPPPEPRNSWAPRRLGRPDAAALVRADPRGHAGAAPVARIGSYLVPLFVVALIAAHLSARC